MGIRSAFRVCFQVVPQTLTLAAVVLVPFVSTVCDPAWAADSASATPPVSASSATTAPAGTHEASVPPTNLPDVPRRQTSAEASPAPNLSAANQLLQRQGPVFIENRGQFDSRVKFLVKGNGANLWLTNEGIVFDLQRPSQKESSDLKGAKQTLDPRLKADQPPMERLVFKQKLVGANISPAIEARGPQSGIYNYFLGSDPDKWRTHVLAYKEVVYRNVWRGVDLRLFANGPNLEEEFIVHSGADANAVQLAYEGVQSLAIGDDGSLKIATAFGDMVETSPRIYEEIGGKSVPLSGNFKLGAQNSYTFEVARHDEHADLIIDPTVIYSDRRPSKKSGQGTLLYSSFLGGSQADTGYAIAVDSAGNAYVTGTTASTDFPTTSGAFQTSGSGVFVTKVNALGSSPLVYSTYLGQGAGGNGIAVDSTGSAYVGGGNANSNFPITANAYSGCGGGSNAFFTKLAPGGDKLTYSTCLINGFAYAVAVDATGNAYLAGYAQQGFPITPGAFQSTMKTSFSSAFFSMINPSASGNASLVYSSYLGGTPTDAFFGDRGLGIAVDAYGQAYITGWTTSADFPVTAGAYMTSYPGSSCTDACDPYLGGRTLPSAFIAKFAPLASGAASLIYSTFLGGSSGTVGNGLAVDPLGNAYVTGSSGNYYGIPGGNNPFPTTAGAYQTTADNNDAFVTKLNAAGNALIYSTLLGGYMAGGTSQFGTSIAIDASMDAYITGWTASGTFPTTANAFQPNDPGNWTQAFATQFNSNASGLLYSSYLGGTQQETTGYGIAVDQVGDAYVTGNTATLDFPVTSFAFQPFYAGGGDAFVTKFPIGVADGLSITGITPTAGGNAGQITPEIVGTGFHLGATAQLNCGGSPVIGQNVTISAGGRILRATFDLTKTSPGTCDVVVTNPDQTSAKLAKGFTVQQGGAANIQIFKTGTLAVKPPQDEPGWPTNVTYYIAVSNMGNIDEAYGSVSQPLDPEMTLSAADPTPVGGVSNSNTLLLWNQNFGAGQHIPFTYSVTIVPSFPVGNPIDTFAGCFVDPLNLNGTCACIAFEDSTSPTCFQIGAQCTQAAQVCLEAYQENSPPLYLECATDLWDCAESSIDCIGESPIGACFQSNGGACVTFVQQLLAGAFDPNYLAGPLGVGAQNWVSGSSGLPYVISFGNDPGAGTAAQQVIVTQPLDPSIDVTTLSLTFVTVPNLTNPAILVTIPPGSFNPVGGVDEFMTNVDLRPVQSLFVTLDAKFNPSTNTINWSFNSIDPATGLPPTNLMIGMLPPGANAAVSFAAKPKQGLATGTQISEQAAVVFNTNPPVKTEVWTNEVDNTPPVSQVLPLPKRELCQNFNVQWSGTDIGSGIGSYTIYVSDNGAPFATWLTNTTSTSGVFIGQIGHSYGFYSIAQDLVGNMEPGKGSAEATTSVIKDTGCGPSGPPTALGQRH